MHAVLACVLALAAVPAHALAAGSGAVEKRFVARLEFPTAADAKPVGLFACDLNADAKDEVVIVTRSPGTLQILGGVTDALQRVPQAVSFPIGDFALGPVRVGPPGSRRIAISSRASPSVQVIDLDAVVKNLRGTLAIEWELPLARRARVLAAGDLDADGKAEVVVVTIDGELVIARSASDVARQALPDEQATCALVSADGHTLYVGFQGTRRIVAYARDAHDPTKLVERASIAIEGLPRALCQVDIDADGQIELAVAGGDDGVWMLHDAGASGKGLTFARGTAREPAVRVSSVPIALAVGNLDGKGASELVAIGLQGQLASVIRIDKGVLVASAVYVGQHPIACALGDTNGDGHTDLLVANLDAKRVSLLAGTGSNAAFTSAPAARTGKAAHSLATGDFDGDGTLDLVSLSSLEATISIALGHTASFGEPRVEGHVKAADAVRALDVDGDGRLDIVLLERTEQGSRIVAFFGDGQGHLAQRESVAPTAIGASSGDLCLADVDGDGVLDVLVSDPAGGRVSLVRLERSSSSGASPHAVKLAVRASLDLLGGPKGLAWLASERLAAVALGGPGQRTGVAFLGEAHANGTTTLVEKSRFEVPASVFALDSADFDDDGRSDLAFLAQRSEVDTFVQVLLATESAVWRPLPELRTSLRPYAIRAGDVDGDGLADLAVSAQNSHHVNFWRALRGPASAPAHFEFARTADLGAGTGCLDIQLADLDLDGQLEILVANTFSNDASLIRLR